MPWTEPDNNDEEGRRSSRPSRGPSAERLEEAMRRLHRRLRGQRPGFSPEGEFRFRNGLVFLFALWVLSGFFIVSPAEQAVIVRLGRYTETLGPGPHWIPRFFERAFKSTNKRF